MYNVRAIRSLALILMASCAVSPEDKAFNWLASSDKSIAVRVHHALPKPDYQVHVSRAEREAARGAAEGALGGLQEALGAHDPAGLALGIVLMPVFALGGAAFGAATAEPDVHHYPLDKVEGAAALFKAVLQGANLKELLKRNIAKRSPTPNGHKLDVVNTEIPARADAADLRIGINTYSLVGELKDNPTISLLVAGGALLRTPKGGWHYFDWSYKSSSRRLSQWSANNAALFKQEVERAAKKSAEDIVANIEGTGKGSDQGR